MALRRKVKEVLSAQLGRIPCIDNKTKFLSAHAKRTLHMGANPADSGFSEEAQPAVLEGELNDIKTGSGSGFDRDAFDRLAEDTLTITLATGEVYTMTGAWIEDGLQADETGGGKFKIISPTSTRTK